MKVIPALLFAMMVACAHVPTNPEQVQSELIALERQRQQAQLLGDWQTIQKLNAPDFAEIAATGLIRTAAQNAEDMRAGRTKFTKVEYTDLVVKSFGNVAIVTGIGHRIGSYDGQPFEQRFRYSRTYAREDGGWKVVFAQSTRLENDR